jgi:hypothetical protein
MLTLKLLLQRRLRTLETRGPSGGTAYIGTTDPSGTNYGDGDTHYDSVLNNLWIFSSGEWSLSNKQLHIRYATAVTGVGTDGTVTLQNQVTGFSITPFDSSGTQKAWRGLWWGSTLVASTDPTDYEWTLTAGEVGADGYSPTYSRYYSNYPGLYSEMGDPDTPGTGVTWTSFTGSAPSTAYWVAEQFTVGSTTSDWAIYPVQAKDGGIPFVTYTIAGSNMPTLGDSTWIEDAVEAVADFTGRSYTNQKEFGYGTTVVITYDDGKLYGRYTRNSSGADTWVAPASFIDGNLIVDGSIAAEQIAATAINTTHLVVSGTNAIDAAAVGADPSGSAAAAQAAAISTAATAAQTKADLAETVAKAYADGIVTTEETRAILDATTKANAAQAAAEAASDALGTASAAVGVVTDNIYTSGTTTIDGGQITTGSITAAEIAADSITADEITSGTITSNELSANAVTASKIVLDGSLEFTEDSSGIHFGKGSLFDGTEGAFFGRALASDGVTEIVGLSITSSTSQMTMTSTGDLNLSGAKLYSGTPGSPNEITSSSTTNLPGGTTDIDLVVTGGGGGGPTNAAGDRPADTRISGSDGGSTIIKFYSGSNGSGTLLNTYTASGGSGGSYSVISNVINRVGTAGTASSAPGSTGGTAGNIPPSTNGLSTGVGDGTLGGGGGSGGANGANGSVDASSNNGGDAGQTLSFTYDATNASSYVVIIGSGGAGGVPAQLTSYIASGGDGGSGYVSVTNAISGGELIDLSSLADKFEWPTDGLNYAITISGQTNINNAIVSLGSGGAGWYYIIGESSSSNYWGAVGNAKKSSGSQTTYRITNAGAILYITGTPQWRPTKNNNNGKWYPCPCGWLKLS